MATVEEVVIEYNDMQLGLSQAQVDLGVSVRAGVEVRARVRVRTCF